MKKIETITFYAVELHHDKYLDDFIFYDKESADIFFNEQLEKTHTQFHTIVMDEIAYTGVIWDKQRLKEIVSCSMSRCRPIFKVKQIKLKELNYNPDEHEKPLTTVDLANYLSSIQVLTHKKTPC